MRKALAFAVVALSLLVHPVGASGQQQAVACNLVTDPAGDAVSNPASYIPILPPGSFSSDDAMDITSVDLASDKKGITAVLRLKRLTATSSNAPTGMTWRTSFTAGGVTFTLAGHASPTGATTFDAAYSSPSDTGSYGNAVIGIFDTVKSEVRITARRTLLSGQTNIRPGTVVKGLNGEAAEEFVVVPNATGGPGSGSGLSSRHSVDLAYGDTDYIGGTRSCVVVGK